MVVKITQSIFKAVIDVMVTILESEAVEFWVRITPMVWNSGIELLPGCLSCVTIANWVHYIWETSLVKSTWRH